MKRLFNKALDNWIEIVSTGLILGLLHGVKIVWFDFPDVKADVETVMKSNRGQGKILCKMAIKDFKGEKDLNEVIEICNREIE